MGFLLDLDCFLHICTFYYTESSCCSIVPLVSPFVFSVLNGREVETNDLCVFVARCRARGRLEPVRPQLNVLWVPH